MRSSAFIIAVLVVLGDQGLGQTIPPAENAVSPAAPPFSSQPGQPGTSSPPSPASPATSRTPPVYSRVASFAIPFSVAQSDKQGLEVALFVSHDFGANWTLYSRQAAAQGQFAFRTNQDGEYWFASRTIPVGTVISAGATFNPELRVVVDTAPPRLDVQAGINSSGEIQVEWQAADDSIAPETLRVEYQQALGKPWQAVPTAKSAPGPGRNAVAGQAAWKPEAGSYLVSVRVQVQDQAGNSQELIRRLMVPIALNSRPAASPTAPASTSASIPSDPFANQGMTNDHPAEPQTASSQEPQKQASPAVPQGVAWPSEVQGVQDHRDPYFTPATDATSGVSAAVGPTGGPPISDSGKVEARPASTASLPAPAAGPGADAAASGGHAASIDQTPAAASDDRPTAAAQADKAAGGAPAASGSLPVGERPRMTSSKRFNLDYSVDAVGPAGVEKVELWVTRNGGRDWDLGWVDEDRESPLLVEVESEGIYGFRVVVVGRNGLASQTPRAGDLADLWVGVDSTKPIAQIASAQYGSDAYAGQLDIRWTASDDHLGNRPVTLSFSDKPDGTWTTIAAGLPNSGQYLWRVDSRVPAEFYLRLEVRDEAGNAAVHRLDQPLQSAGLTPKGSVRGIAPVAN